MVIVTTWTDSEILTHLSNMAPEVKKFILKKKILPRIKDNQVLFEAIILNNDKMILEQMPEYPKKEEKEKEEEILDDTSKLKIALWYLNKFETIEEAQRFLTAAKEARQRVRRK